jgi:hypothetical protein
MERGCLQTATTWPRAIVLSWVLILAEPNTFPNASSTIDIPRRLRRIAYVNCEILTAKCKSVEHFSVPKDWICSC